MGLCSKSPIFELLLCLGRLGVVTRLGLAAAFAQLLLDFLCDDVNGRVKVLLAVLGKKIRTTNAETDGTGERLFRRARVVVFEGDSRVNHPLVQVVKLFNLGHYVIFNGLG